MWLLLGVIAQLLPRTGVTSFTFLVSSFPFRFSGLFGAKTMPGSSNVLHSGLAARSVWHIVCHQSLTRSLLLDMLGEGTLSQLLWVPSLAAGKRGNTLPWRCLTLN